MLKDVKFTENFLPLRFDFNAEILKFMEYFYPLKLNFNADFQKFSAGIHITFSYVELRLYQ